MVVIFVCVVLGLVGLGVLRGQHKRMLARIDQREAQAEREAKAAALRSADVKSPTDAIPCHVNAPRTWKVAVNSEPDTPYKSLALSNPSGDMSLFVVMRPRDEALAGEVEVANKAAAQRTDKNTLVEDGWLELPVQRAWREMRNLPDEQPALTELSYFIRKPAFDLHLRARMPALRFPPFRKFIEDIMRSVYCDEPAKAPAGTP